MALRFNYTEAAFRICVDTADDSRICGRIASQRLRSPIAFSDINDLIKQLDTIMDVQLFPKAFMSIRSFSDAPPPAQLESPAALSPEEMLDAAVVDSLQGELITFLLHITVRQNASWQGFIEWLDGSPRQNFNSTLEFLRALDLRITSLS